MNNLTCDTCNKDITQGGVMLSSFHYLCEDCYVDYLEDVK